MSALALSCGCGAVHGTVGAAEPVNRLTCYCADCRAFARHGIERGGRDVTDASGGSEMFQVTAGSVRLDGAEHLAALRVTPHGPVRWYCGACGTPIANTLHSPALPFASFPVANLSGEHGAMGMNRGAVFTDTAPAPPLLRDMGRAGMVRVMGRFARAMLRARLRGEHRRSPFHHDGRPIAEPRVMAPDERARLARAAP